MQSPDRSQPKKVAQEGAGSPAGCLAWALRGTGVPCEAGAVLCSLVPGCGAERCGHNEMKSLPCWAANPRVYLTDVTGTSSTHSAPTENCASLQEPVPLLLLSLSGQLFQNPAGETLLLLWSGLHHSCSRGAEGPGQRCCTSCF